MAAVCEIPPLGWISHRCRSEFSPWRDRKDSQMFSAQSEASEEEPWIVSAYRVSVEGSQTRNLGLQDRCAGLQEATVLRQIRWRGRTDGAGGGGISAVRGFLVLVDGQGRVVLEGEFTPASESVVCSREGDQARGENSSQCRRTWSIWRQARVSAAEQQRTARKLTLVKSIHNTRNFQCPVWEKSVGSSSC